MCSWSRVPSFALRAMTDMVDAAEPLPCEAGIDCPCTVEAARTKTLATAARCALRIIGVSLTSDGDGTAHELVPVAEVRERAWPVERQFRRRFLSRQRRAEGCVA